MQPSLEGFVLACVTHWIAVTISWLEIEIEGTHGWASKLPTWRRSSILCGTRPLTGYHISLSLVLISVVSCGGIVLAIWDTSWLALACILLSLSIFVCAMLFEDAYWFVFNYAFHDAFLRGEAANHFKTRIEQLQIHFVCAAVSSALFILGYGAKGRWGDGGVSLGIFWLSSVAASLVVRTGVRPLYIVTSTYLHNKKIANANQLLAQSAIVLLSCCICILSLYTAIGVWKMDLTLRSTV